MRLARAAGVLFGLLLPFGAAAAEPWVISSEVILTSPRDVTTDIVVVSGGRLLVRGVPAPGIRLFGNLFVMGDGSVEMTGSVVQVMSTFHSQLSLVAIERASVRVEHCLYVVPNGVQHALVAAGGSRIDLSDSVFPFAQLLATDDGSLTAIRIDGVFECILMDRGHLELTDIPLHPGQGRCWVWPTFMSGSHAVFAPPAAGFVGAFSLPRPDDSGIGWSVAVSRCEIGLWPILVREGVDLTLRDVTPAARTVVGLALPGPVEISGLRNGGKYDAFDLPLADRTVRLENSTIATWNLYPEGTAQVTVRGCLIGELLANGASTVRLYDTVVDGSGGYFGAGDEATVEAEGCTFTCDVRAVKSSLMTLRTCAVKPYAVDMSGQLTHHGAYENAVLHLDRSPATSARRLGGAGQVVVTDLSDPPSRPRRDSQELHGTAAVSTVDPAEGLASWTLSERTAKGRGDRRITMETEAVEEGLLGTWRGADPARRYELRLAVEDRRGRTYTTTVPVPTPWSE